jgi:hypothetical protein
LRFRARADELERAAKASAVKAALQGESVASDPEVLASRQEAERAEQLTPGMVDYVQSEGRRNVRELGAELATLAGQMQLCCQARAREIIGEVAPRLGELVHLFGADEVKGAFAGQGQLANLGRFPTPEGAAGAAVWDELREIERGGGHAGGGLPESFKHLARQLDRLAACERVLAIEGAPKA